MFSQEKEEHGADWNPSAANLLLQRWLSLDNRTDFVGALRSSVGEAGGASQRLSPMAEDNDARWSVLTQAFEVNLPAAVTRLVGNRYSADWIVSRFSCSEQRGFFFSSSRRTELIAMLAGVQPTQEMCMSAILMAPAGEKG